MKVKWKIIIGVVAVFLVYLLVHFGMIFSESSIKIVPSPISIHKETGHEFLLLNSQPDDDLEHGYGEFRSVEPDYYNSLRGDGSGRNGPHAFGIMPGNIEQHAYPLNNVDRLLGEMKWGRIVFNAPADINIDDSPTIQLILSLTETVEKLKQSITGEGEKIGADIKVHDKMEAHLSGHMFKITAITPEIQGVSKNQQTEWRWEIFPEDVGTHDLHLTLSAILLINGESTPRTIKTFDKIIEVNVTGKQWTLRFWTSNWKWLLGTLLFPLVLFLWTRRKNS